MSAQLVSIHVELKYTCTDLYGRKIRAITDLRHDVGNIHIYIYRERERDKTAVTPLDGIRSRSLQLYMVRLSPARRAWPHLAARFRVAA